MKKTLKRVMLILLVVLFGTALAGCKIGMDTLEEILEKNQLKAQITYYSNGGYFNEENSKIYSRDVYYKENSKALEITDTTQTKIKHREHLYGGWYTILTEKIDGESYFVCNIDDLEVETYKINDVCVIKQSNGKNLIKIQDYEKLVSTSKVPLLALDKPFDFSAQRLNAGDRLYLATNWLPNQKVEYVLLTEDCPSITVLNDDGSEKTFNNGDVITTQLFNSNGIFTVPTDYKLSPVDSLNATFIDYYVYSENPSLDNLTRLYDHTTTLVRPEDGSNIKIFVKFTAGDWEVIRFASDVQNIFTDPTKNYYISQDIDCSQLKEITSFGKLNFRGVIRGNGNEISGLKFKADKVGAKANVSLFGTVSSGASVKDLTFKDISITVTTRPIENNFINVYLIASAVRDGAEANFENLKFNGVNVEITLEKGVSIENMGFDGTSYNTSSWIYKGLDNNAFTELYPTFTLENYQLKINSVTVATDSQATLG